MDLIQEVKQLREERLHKIQQNNKKEYHHAWFTNDPWITHKIYKNVITNTYHEVSYITKEIYNPLPFHVDITYVGMVHVDKIYT